MLNLAFSEVSSVPYYDANVKNETKTYAPNLISMW